MVSSQSKLIVINIIMIYFNYIVAPNNPSQISEFTRCINKMVDACRDYNPTAKSCAISFIDNYLPNTIDPEIYHYYMDLQNNLLRGDSEATYFWCKKYLNKIERKICRKATRDFEGLTDYVLKRMLTEYLKSSYQNNEYKLGYWNHLTENLKIHISTKTPRNFCFELYELQTNQPVLPVRPQQPFNPEQRFTRCISKMVEACGEHYPTPKACTVSFFDNYLHDTIDPEIHPYYMEIQRSLITDAIYPAYHWCKTYQDKKERRKCRKETIEFQGFITTIVDVMYLNITKYPYQSNEYTLGYWNYVTATIKLPNGVRIPNNFCSELYGIQTN